MNGIAIGAPAARTTRQARTLLHALVAVLLAAPALAAAATPAPKIDLSVAGAFAQARAQAEHAVALLAQRYPGLDASWTAQMPGPNLLLGLSVDLGAAAPTQSALRFARDHADLWGLRGDELQLWQASRTGDRTAVRVNQTVQSPFGRLIVLDRAAVLTVDRAGRLLSITSDLLAAGDVGAGSVSEKSARELAKEAAMPGRSASATAVSARRAAWATLAGTRPVWAVDVTGSAAAERFAVIIDAISGAALAVRPVALH